MNGRALGNGVVHEDDLAAAGVVGCGQQHALRIDVADAVGLEVGDHDDLLADQLLGRVALLDGGHDHTLAKSVRKRKLQAGVRLAHRLGLEDLAHAQIQLVNILDRDLGLYGLYGIGLADLLNGLLDGLLCGSVGGLLRIGLRIGEVQKLYVLLGLDGVEEKIQTRTLFLVDQELVDVAEEGALQTLELLVGHFGAVNGLGDRVKLGVQLVQRVAALGDIGVQKADRLLLLLGHALVDLPVARGAQTVDLVGCALLQPELGAIQTVGKLLGLVGRADLFKDGLEHGDVEVDDGAQLHEQGHGHRLDLAALDAAVVKDILHGLARSSLAGVGEHLVKLEVLAQNAVVEAEVKGLGGIGLGVEPENDLGLIELEKRLGGEVQTRGGGHLAGHALDADELVALEEGRLKAEDLAGDDLGVAVGARGCGVILSARLKVHALVSPAHGPVHLPAQLAVGVGEEVEVSLMAAAADVIRLGAVLGEAGHGGEIGVADGAEDADGAVSRLLGVMLGASFLLGLGKILGLEGVEDLKDLASLAKRLENVLAVGAAAVHLALVAAIQLDAKLLHGVEEFLLKMLGVVLVTAPGVGNIHVGAADIFVVVAAHLGLHVGRDLAAAVELVPGEKKLCPLALLLQSLDHHQGGGHVAEIADVDRAGGADARGADVLILIGVARNNALRDLFRPMHSENNLALPKSHFRNP